MIVTVSTWLLCSGWSPVDASRRFFSERRALAEKRKPLSLSERERLLQLEEAEADRAIAAAEDEGESRVIRLPAKKKKKAAAC